MNGSIGVSSIDRENRKFVAALVFSLIYVASIAIQLGGIILESNLFHEVSQKAGGQGFWGFILSLKLMSAIITQGTNLLFSRVTAWIVTAQSCLSHSEAMRRHTKKLIFIQFFNTISTQVGLSFLSKQYGGLDNLPQKLLGQLIVNVFLNPLLHAFSVSHMIRQLRIIYQVNNKVSANKPIVMTQQELHKLMEPPKIDLPTRYTSIVRTFLVACFCVSLVPIAPWVCAVFLVVQYQMDHYLIVKRYKKIKRLHESFSLGIAEIAEMGGFCVLLGHCVFSLRSELLIKHKPWIQVSLWVQVCCMLIAGFLAMVSVRSFQAFYLSAGESPRPPTENSLHPEVSLEQTKSEQVEKRLSHFESDYMRLNPLTRETATAQYFANIQTQVMESARVGEATGGGRDLHTSEYLD